MLKRVKQLIFSLLEGLRSWWLELVAIILGRLKSKQETAEGEEEGEKRGRKEKAS